MTRIPVFIVGKGYLSGVSTWAEQVRKRLADHPTYDIQLLHVGPGTYEHADVTVDDVEAAHRHIVESAPAIVFPNYVWELFLTGFSPGVRCIGMCHADSEEQYYLPLTWYEALISQFIGVSPECQQNLNFRFGFRSDDVSLLPYGIPVAPKLSRQYSTQPIRIVYAGRVTQLQKRVWDFIPLVEELMRRNVDFVFDVVGDGDQRLALEEAMLARFPKERVRFRGLLPHAAMADIWRNHDVFVQTSDFEGTSVSMLEAMASGVVPVVTAASSGVSGVIEPGVNGFVAPVGAMETVADAIARLAADKPLLASAGAAAHQTAQGYSIEKYGVRFTEILDRAMDGGPRTVPAGRYGMFTDLHPLLAQQTQLSALQRQLEQRNHWSLQNLNPWKRNPRPKPAPAPAVAQGHPAAEATTTETPKAVRPKRDAASSAIAFDRSAEPGLTSIVMPTFRGERFIGATLATVSAQTNKNWELIVVEDGDEARSQQIVQEFASRHPHNRIVYWRNHCQRGASFSRNVAFTKSAGEFVALLDCDDRWTPDHLEKSVDALQTTDAEIVYSTVLFVADQTEMPLGTWGPTPQDLYDFPKSLMGRNYVTPSATVLRRSVLADVGPWNTTLRYCEDYEYWLRCIAAEKQFHWLGGCHCYYRKNHAGATTQKLCGTLEEVAQVTEQFIGLTSIREKTCRRLTSKAYAHAAEYHAKSNPEADPSADFAHAANLYWRAWRLRPSHIDYPVAAAKIKLASLFRRRPEVAIVPKPQPVVIAPARPLAVAKKAA